MKLFARIFLSFWLATILMIGVVPTITERLPVILPGDSELSIAPDALASGLSSAVSAYERDGAGAFVRAIQSVPMVLPRAFYLFDGQGKTLVETPPLAPFYAKAAADVLQGGHVRLFRFGYRTLFACPIQSTSGRRYAAVVTLGDPVRRLFNSRLWFELGLAVIPVSLICMILSLYLTRPITSLQATAQRLAAGDLSARAIPANAKRTDELGQLARDFDVMAAQIQSLMTAQRRFVADVSHELGGPLTRMHLALALLRRQFTERNGGAIDRLERETAKLNNLVKQLLLLARMEAGSLPVEAMAPVSMRSLCENIVEDASFEAAHAQCQITGSRQDVTLLVYPQLLHRTVDNVLRNAIRYAPAGTEVSLDCRVIEDSGQVILEISDCGPGVPEHILKDIFRAFFRAAPGRESGSGGTGLGLAIASEAVQLHGGTIEAVNRKEGGLRVTITLPLKVPALEKTEPADHN
jgi:two-component system, OmpR family, sensor histidine kinase CpxA